MKISRRVDGQEGRIVGRQVLKMVGRKVGRKGWRDRWWWAPPAVHLKDRLNFNHYSLVQHDSCAV